MIFKDIVEDKSLGYYYSPGDYPDAAPYKLMESILQVTRNHYKKTQDDRFDAADSISKYSIPSSKGIKGILLCRSTTIPS